ncbi:TlpA family protein disulfide reductase [bacterium]|jgi:thiol-disulfide isomerase/thioredoxin|nr:TlpA family protein disulfide reductase [bacterium]
MIGPFRTWDQFAPRRAVGTILIVAIALLGGCSRPPLGEVTIANDFELRRHSNGEIVHFAHMRGKTLFFHVWATWCGPCVVELPSVVRLADSLRDDPNIEFVLVSLDEKLEDLDQFIEAKGLTLPVYSLVTSLPNDLQTDGIPATFFIDSSGKIRRQEVGSSVWDRQSIVDELKQIARESPGSKVAQSSSAVPR